MRRYSTGACASGSTTASGSTSLPRGPLPAGNRIRTIRGDELSATLLSPEGRLAPAQVRGRVVWAGSRETGIEVFEQSAGYRTLLAAAAGRWALVEELEHATGQRQP